MWRGIVCVQNVNKEEIMTSGAGCGREVSVGDSDDVVVVVTG